MKSNRLLKIFLLVCWLVLIASLLTMPLPASLPVSLGTAYDDKIVHMALFGGLVYFLVEVVESFYLLRYAYVVLVSIVLSAVYAQILEIAQSFLPDRTMSAADTLAGAAGALLAAGAIYWFDYRRLRKPALLLHICCIGCGVAVVERLREDWDVVLFFYNPNIFPVAEYRKRLREIERVAKEHKLRVIVSQASHRVWRQKVAGYEQEPEKGARCRICYQDRLAATAKRAARLGYAAFSSTLSISPHKDYRVIKELGERLALKYGVRFLDEDYKKGGGFQRSCALSKELKLYRQDYCGCEFSLAAQKARINKDA